MSRRALALAALALTAGCLDLDPAGKYFQCDPGSGADCATTGSAGGSTGISTAGSTARASTASTSGESSSSTGSASATSGGTPAGRTGTASGSTSGSTLASGSSSSAVSSTSGASSTSGSSSSSSSSTASSSTTTSSSTGGTNGSSGSTTASSTSTTGGTAEATCLPKCSAWEQCKNLKCTPFGSGDGTFSAGVQAAVATSVQALALADVDGDGNLDVVTVSSGSDTVHILLGRGDGTFYRGIPLVPDTFPSGSHLVQSIAVGDVTGDGVLDIVTAGASDDAIHVLKGSGDGSFGAPLPLSMPRGSLHVALADLNRDGRLDIAVLVDGATMEVATFLGQADGTLERGPDSALTNTYGYPEGLTIIDLDGDRVPDVVVTEVAKNGHLGMVDAMVNDGSAKLSEPDFQPLADASLPVQSATMGDLTGSGWPDVEVAFKASSTPWDDLLTRHGSVLVGFYRDQSYESASSGESHGIATGDFNGDGHLDIALGGDVDVAVFLNDPSIQSLHPSNAFAWPGGGHLQTLAVGDLNHDGKLDLVGVLQTGDTADAVSVLLGN